MDQGAMVSESLNRLNIWFLSDEVAFEVLDKYL